jgi:F-type H+-transporting ATPase subunit b
MKKIKQISCLALCMMCGALLLHVMGADAFAGEKGDWRPTYDLVMKWVNFAILVFLIVWFGRKPIMNFLRSQKEEVAEEIELLEKKKAELAEEIRKTQKALEESDAHFADLKDKIILQGEKRKQELIEDARKQSEYMMETAKKKIGNQILQAKQAFKTELIDAAMDIAEKRLPKEMTHEDNEKMVNLYLSSVSAA